MGTTLARSLCLFLMFSWVATSRADDEEVPRVEPSSSAPGGKVLEWTSPEGKPYWYRLPKRMRATRPPALIVMLHGTGVPYQWAFWNYPIANGAWRPNDIVVAPEGMTPGGENRFNFVQGKDDGDHIAGLIRNLKKRLPIGPVYVYGHSQGAFFAYWFAGEHPDLIDGIVAHAGNVLDVKHAKLAKEKVAIGILHGKADAVVTVECAYRSERIYREQGYKKLKLEIVEGLTEQSGHWPLPVQVDAMLNWLDRVSTPDAAHCLEIAMAELGRERVDLAIVADALARGTSLVKKRKSDDRAAIEARLARFENWMQEVAVEHAEALMAEPAMGERKLPFGPWSAHFRRAESAFGSLPSWSAAMKAPQSVAKSHARGVDKALEEMGRPSKSTAAELFEALSSGYLASRYDELEVGAARFAETPPKGTPPATVSALVGLLAARRTMTESGDAAYFKLNATAAQRLRETDPELLQPIEAEAEAAASD